VPAACSIVDGTPLTLHSPHTLLHSHCAHHSHSAPLHYACSHCTPLTLHATHTILSPTAAPVPMYIQVPSLRYLNLAECSLLTDAALEAVGAHLQGCVDLCLYGCGKLTDSAAVGLMRYVTKQSTNHTTLTPSLLHSSPPTSTLLTPPTLSPHLSSLSRQPRLLLGAREYRWCVHKIMDALYSPCTICTVLTIHYIHHTHHALHSPYSPFTTFTILTIHYIHHTHHSLHSLQVRTRSRMVSGSPPTMLHSHCAPLTLYSPHTVLPSHCTPLTLCSPHTVLHSHCAPLPLCSTQVRTRSRMVSGATC
jgi:hypothetical protein